MPALAVAALMIGGCSAHPNSAGWTPDQAKAFRGGPPPPGEGKEIAEAIRRQREHPPQMAPGFSPIAPYPKRASSQ